MSKPLARVHCPSLRWRSRAVTSLAHGAAEDDLAARAAAAPRGRAGRSRRRARPRGRPRRDSRRGTGSASPGPITDVDGLRKTTGLRGRLAAHLAGVLGVVLADRDDLAGQHRREQPDVGASGTARSTAGTAPNGCPSIAVTCSSSPSPSTTPNATSPSPTPNLQMRTRGNATGGQPYDPPSAGYRASRGLPIGSRGPNSATKPDGQSVADLPSRRAGPDHVSGRRVQRLPGGLDDVVRRTPTVTHELSAVAGLDEHPGHGVGAVRGVGDAHLVVDELEPLDLRVELAERPAAARGRAR